MKTLSKCILLFLAAFLLLPMLLSAQHPQDTFKAKKPGIVAHRGFHRFEGLAENSISSMQHAVAHDFEGTEFDVQLTSDNVAIVFHDSKTQGRAICDTPFDTLRQLQAFTLKNGETVPTLDEFLEACSIAIKEQLPREKHTQLFFEIKPLQRKEQRYHLLGQIIEAIGKYQLQVQRWRRETDMGLCSLWRELYVPRRWRD
jgi:glycerophosphoryl diester phosphodiesterase